MKKVLIAVWIDAHFIELSRVAHLLNSTNKYQPVIWFVEKYRVLDRDLDTCRKEGWEFINPPTEIGFGDSKLFKWIKPKILLLLKSITLVGFTKLKRSSYTRLIKHRVLLFKGIISKYHPALIIMSEDNVGYATNIVIRIAKETGINTVIIPYTIANETEAAEYHYNEPEYSVQSNWINTRIGKRYPRWVYTYRNKQLLRMHAGAIEAIEQSGYHPERPWILNDEESAIVAVENQQMYQIYSQQLSVERLVVTGALYDDVLSKTIADANKRKNNLYRQMNLDLGRRLLLCALPPSQFPRRCEFENYESLLAYWMLTLAAIPGWNVIVRPHPRQTEGEIRNLAHYGVKISTHDTASLIPLCDLYLASVSATIRWAIACGKPVINYDVYQMRYKDYADVESVITIYDKSSFDTVLKRITTDQNYYNLLEARQLEAAPAWGMLDGKSSERMLKLFEDVIAGKYRRSGK